MLKAIFGIVTGAIQLFTGWITGRRDEKLREDGRNEARFDQSRDAIDAHRRMDDAAARPRGTTQDAFDDGKY